MNVSNCDNSFNFLSMIWLLLMSAKKKTSGEGEKLCQTLVLAVYTTI